MEIIVSFVVPVYNIGKYVPECIESLLAQDTQQMEVILVNDGSQDDSGDICEQYAQKDSRIRVIHQENAGVASARNAGIKSAVGKWICFIDGDDWVEAQLWQKLKPYFDLPYDIVFFGYQHVNSGKKVCFQNDESELKLVKNDFQKLQIGIFNANIIGAKYKNIPYLTPWGKLFNRDFLERNDLLYTLGVQKGQDGLFNMRAFECADSGLYTNNILYNYRINSESICHRYNPNIDKILDNLLQKYSDFIREHAYEGLIKNFYVMKLRQLMYCIVLNYCHKDNKYSYRQRKKDFFEALSKQNYCDVFDNISIGDLRFQERVLAILIKLRFFFLIDILNKIRT